MSSAQIQTEAPFVQDSPRKRRQGNDDLGDASMVILLATSLPILTSA